MYDASKNEKPAMDKSLKASSILAASLETA
jgi:hypothetical protein